MLKSYVEEFFKLNLRFFERYGFMFEKYNVDDLYLGEVSVVVPYSIENIGGAHMYDGLYLGSYQTILYFDGSRYVDIYHPNFIVNAFDVPSRKSLEVSKNRNLYTINTQALKKYRDVFKDVGKGKVLQRLPFKKRKLLEK